MSVVIIIIPVIIVAIFLYILLRGNWSLNAQRLSKHIPGPVCYPIIGNSLDYLHLDGTVGIWNLLRGYVKKYGSCLGLWTLNFYAMILSDADDIEIILSNIKHIDKGNPYHGLLPWLQTGLLTSTGKKWHSRRKILTPAFHFNILQNFISVFSEQSSRLVKLLKIECNNSETDIVPYVTKCALNIICETAMGISVDTNDKKIVNYKQAIYKFGKLFFIRLLSPWIYNDLLFSISPTGRSTKKQTKILHEFTNTVIKKRIDEWDNSIIDNATVSSAGKKRLAMLDLLISQKMNGEDIDVDGIREEVDTFMFEGHDTTSMAISFTLLMLANFREIQDRCVEELHNIFGDDKSTPTTYQQLQNMNYLEMCLKESLRLYPAVPQISRTISEDVKLTKYTVPAGSFIHIFIYDLHRNPKYWPNPDVYDPDRFLPENSYNRHPFAYIPFSAGPRNCIGQKFALLEEKCVISSILRNYTLEAVDTPESITLMTDLVIRSSEGLRIKIRARQ